MKPKGKNLIASHLNALDKISNDVMVVLVPIDQIKNTAYRVSENTFYTLHSELHRAWSIIKTIAPESKIIYKQRKPTAEEPLDLTSLCD